MKDITARIASTLKSLRQARGWSLDGASQKTGVSKAMLGQIERGESSPTIATLWKIASGFDTSFSSFVEDLPIHQESPTSSSGEFKQLHPEDDKIRVMPIFPYDNALNFEVFIIELLSGCEHLSPPHQRGVIEHVIVARGDMEVLVGGTWYPLKEKEGLRFPADQPHGYRNRSSQGTIFHDMIHYSES